MEFLAQNWFYFLLIGGYILLMLRGGGGCCGGYSHREGSNAHHQSGCGTGNERYDSGQKDTVFLVSDPQCGMQIDPDTAIKQKLDGQTYYFCSENCRKDFVEGHLQKRLR